MITKKFNELTKDQQRIVKQLAIAFNRISTPDFVKWVVLSMGQMPRYNDEEDGRKLCKGVDSEECDTALNFLENFSYSFIPGLIQCKNQQEKMNYLKDDLVPTLTVFGNSVTIKYSLAAIGTAFMFDYVKYHSDGEQIMEYMTILSTLMGIAEDMEELEFYEDQLTEDSTGKKPMTILIDTKIPPLKPLSGSPVS